MDPTIDIAERTSLTPSREEVSSGVPTEETIAIGAAMFARDGFLIMNDVFDPELLHNLARLQSARFAELGADGLARTNMSVGDKRYQVLLEMEAEYGDPQLWANPIVIGILRRLFDGDCVIGGFGSVVAMPGAEMQIPHRDVLPIFGLTQTSAALPPYCATLLVPLVDLDSQIGTTAMSIGSHTNLDIGVGNFMEHPVAFPHVKVGACYLFDYRTFHVGLSNDTDRIRPLLFTTYHRSWFREHLNFRGYVPVQLSDERYAGMSEDHRALLALSDAAHREHTLARQAGMTLDERYVRPAEEPSTD